MNTPLEVAVPVVGELVFGDVAECSAVLVAFLTRLPVPVVPPCVSCDGCAVLMDWQGVPCVACGSGRSAVEHVTCLTYT